MIFGKYYITTEGRFILLLAAFAVMMKVGMLDPNMGLKEGLLLVAGYVTILQCRYDRYVAIRKYGKCLKSTNQ